LSLPLATETRSPVRPPPKGLDVDVDMARGERSSE
jgi:hypothetical protein